MGVIYKIEVENDISADIWKTITDKFNCVLEKHHHASDEETLNVHLKIIGKKAENN